MPCDQVRTYSLANFNVLNFKLLKEAASAIGASQIYVDEKRKAMSFRLDGQYVDIQGGQLTTTTNAQRVASRLKVEYGKQTVYQARRFGMVVHDVTNAEEKQRGEAHLKIGWRS
jgi:hypothetical protein